MSSNGDQEKGDNAIPQVFISFDQLLVSPSDEKSKQSTSEGKTSKTRRPDVAIYRPGSNKRLAKSPTASAASVTSPSESGTVTESNGPSTSIQKKKRPDQQKYAPKRPATSQADSKSDQLSKDVSCKQSEERVADRSDKPPHKSSDRRRSKNKDTEPKIFTSSDPVSNGGLGKSVEGENAELSAEREVETPRNTRQSRSEGSSKEKLNEVIGIRNAGGKGHNISVGGSVRKPTTNEMSGSTSSKQESDRKGGRRKSDTLECQSESGKAKLSHNAKSNIAGSDVKTEAASDRRIESQPNNRAEATSDSRIESKPNNRAEASSGRKIESKPSNRVEATSDCRIESKPTNRAEVSSCRKIESKPNNRVDATSDNRTESKPGNRTEATSDNRAESKFGGRTDSNSDKKSVSFSDGGDVDSSLDMSDLRDSIAVLSMDNLSNSGDALSSRQRKKSAGKPGHESKKGRRGDGPSANSEASSAQRSRGGIIRMPSTTESTSCAESNSRRQLYDPNDPAPSRTANRAVTQDSDQLYEMYPGAPVYPGVPGYPSPASYADPLYDPAYMLPITNPSPYSFNRSPYQTSEQSCDQSYGRANPRQQKIAAVMRDALPLERQLSSLTCRRLQLTRESLEHINRLRDVVREKLEQAVQLDLEYSTNHNIDQLLWKSVYHQMLENFRGQLQSGEEEDSQEDIRSEIDKILKEAENNYTLLLAKLQRTFQFDLSNYTSPLRPQPINRSLKLALIMCQRLLICLGDIARYRTQNTRPISVDYGRARKVYLQASHVAPKNGKPYNQLAIIALYAKRRLDTVFYFMRSITASNAFQSAKESLHTIYNDIIKKYNIKREESERRKEKSRKWRQSSSISSSHKRIEHWVSPLDGSSTTDHVDADEDLDNPQKMSCNEVYRILMSTFLSCQGMIFSKVGLFFGRMENFPEASSQVLYYLKALISHAPLPQLDLTKLIQMFALCMFSICHSGLQVDTSALDTEKCRTYTQEQAVLLFIDMTTVLVQRCTSLISNHSECSLDDLITYDLRQLLPVVKLATDWMTCHPHLWNPPPCPRDPILGPVLDPWLSFAKLTNCLGNIRGVGSIRFYNVEEVDADVPNKYIWLPLQEETDLRGFQPLISLANEGLFIQDSSISQDAATMCHRVKKLITFADYLCGIEPSMLDFDTRGLKYKSLVDPPSLSEQTSASKATNNTQLDEDGSDITDLSDSGSDADADSSGTTRELRKAKQRLSKQLAKQQKQQKMHQAVLDNETHRAIRLEIRPVFVVPDTNCFIEYPHQMKLLITSQRFTVIVPLVVINELDGISNNKLKQPHLRYNHSEAVRKDAVDAMDFLEAEFESRNKRLKAVTVSGTELASISFRTEETDTIGNNDDKILSCCLHYCQDNARNFMPKERDKAITLYREVVLVTDDRNLRLKAHTRNVPVKDLVQFMEWAGIYSAPVK